MATPFTSLKTTAVWLFQEGERVHVSRSPFPSLAKTTLLIVTRPKEIRDCVSNVIVPTVCEVIAVGDIRVFMFAWKIGKVLWFLTLVKQKREASNTKEQAMIIRVNKKQQELCVLGLPPLPTQRYLS